MGAVRALTHSRAEPARPSWTRTISTWASPTLSQGLLACWLLCTAAPSCSCCCLGASDGGSSLLKCMKGCKQHAQPACCLHGCMYGVECNGLALLLHGYTVRRERHSLRWFTSDGTWLSRHQNHACMITAPYGPHSLHVISKHSTDQCCGLLPTKHRVLSRCSLILAQQHVLPSTTLATIEDAFMLPSLCSDQHSSECLVNLAVTMRLPPAQEPVAFNVQSIGLASECTPEVPGANTSALCERSAKQLSTVSRPCCVLCVACT